MMLFNRFGQSWTVGYGLFVGGYVGGSVATVDKYLYNIKSIHFTICRNI